MWDGRHKFFKTEARRGHSVERVEQILNDIYDRLPNGSIKYLEI